MKIWQRFLMGFGNNFPIKIRIKCFKLAGMKIGSNPDISFGFYADRPEGIVIGDNCFFNHYALTISMLLIKNSKQQGAEMNCHLLR